MLLSRQPRARALRTKCWSRSFANVAGRKRVSMLRWPGIMNCSPASLCRSARGTAAESARDAFLYLLAFSTLAIWTIALGSLAFTLIDRWIPDPVAAQAYISYRNAVSYQIASIIVAFPIFLVVMSFILREVESSPERLQSGVRKWLTYIALLLTAGTMIGDLVVFLTTFLQGELTVRFVLKAIVVILIAGSIFWY